MGDVMTVTEGPILILDEADIPAAGPERRPRRLRSRLVAAVRAIASAGEWLFGALSLIVGLATLAAVPIVQLLSFGYLLECTGRVARTGRVRDGFIGFRKAARVGGLVAGSWLSLLPVWYVSSMTKSAHLIDPGGATERPWRLLLVVLTVLTLLHVAAACARGGRLRYFFWPFGNPFWLAKRLRRGGFYAEARDATWDFITCLRLPYYFRMGFYGFLGTMAWLFVPVLMLGPGRKVPLIGVIGALALGVIAMSLPFLQANFAVERRISAIFSYRTVRARFRRAPWAFTAALFVTLTAAVPLYLLKIEMIPRDAAWLPSLFFVAFLYPARLATGWAYARADRRPAPRHWTFRLIGRVGMIPVVAIYVGIVFLAQYTSWGGISSLYEQHAFLLPVPFLSM